MRQSLRSPFRANAFGTAIADPVLPSVTPYTSLWTPGATLIDKVQPLGGPEISQLWRLISIEVHGYLGLSNSTTPLYGKFGRLIAGVLLDVDVGLTSQAGGIGPYVFPMSPIPDGTLTADLWSEDNDPMPPSISGGLSNNNPPPPSLLPVSGEIFPPVPLELLPGIMLGVGLWMTPSLLGWASNLAHPPVGLVLAYPTYTVNYDDGR